MVVMQVMKLAVALFALCCRMDPNYSFFLIDKHLKRFESALYHISLCPEEEYFQECLDLVKVHKLYSKVGISLVNS
jgi:hypothetical protein